MGGGVLSCECYSSGVKIVIPSLTNSLWWRNEISAHHLHPPGRSTRVPGSPFCTNHSELVSPKRTSTASPNEYILFCSFLSQGQKYKNKTKQKWSNVQHKIFNTRPSAKKATASFRLKPKGSWVSFTILNRDNYFDVSWWIRSVYRTKAGLGVLCTLRNNYFLCLFTFWRKHLPDRFRSWYAGRKHL